MRALISRPDLAIQNGRRELASDFTSWARCLIASGGRKDVARQLFGTNTRRAGLVEVMTKAAIDPGRADGAAWGGELAPLKANASAFLEMVRSASIMGKIAGWRRVPFDVQVPRATGGTSAGWVGEGRVAPVSAMAFDSVSLGYSKISGILVYSKELAKLADPDAERLFATDFTASVAAFADASLIDPTMAATDISPASLTNGTTPVTASGNDLAALRKDLAALLNAMAAGGSSLDSIALVMTKSAAARIALIEGVPRGLGPNGGELCGIPVLTTTASMSSGSSPDSGENIVGIDASQILLADGAIEVSASEEGSLQMDSAPDSPETASTIELPLWQHGFVALKTTRFINWKKGRAGAGQYISNANYGG